MKKSVLSLVVAVALLVPQAGMHAQEPVTEQKKELSSWTGGFLSSLGKAIKKREYKKLPSIVAKYKKTAAGIGALLVLGAVEVVVKLFASRQTVPQGYVAKQFTQQRSENKPINFDPFASPLSVGQVSPVIEAPAVPVIEEQEFENVGQVETGKAGQEEAQKAKAFHIPQVRQIGQQQLRSLGWASSDALEASKRARQEEEERRKAYQKAEAERVREELGEFSGSPW